MKKRRLQILLYVYAATVVLFWLLIALSEHPSFNYFLAVFLLVTGIFSMIASFNSPGESIFFDASKEIKLLVSLIGSLIFALLTGIGILLTPTELFYAYQSGIIGFVILSAASLFNYYWEQRKESPQESPPVKENIYILGRKADDE